MTVLQVLLEPVGAPQQDWQWGTGKALGSSDSPQGDRPPALLVGNTHLLFNPKRGDIKVGDSGASQLASSLAALHSGRCPYQTWRT